MNSDKPDNAYGGKSPIIVECRESATLEKPRAVTIGCAEVGMRQNRGSGWTSPEDNVGRARQRLRARLNAAASELRAAVAESWEADAAHGVASKYVQDALGLVEDAERVFRFDRRPRWTCPVCGPVAGARCSSCGARRAHRAVAR